jgi:DNA-binding LytR/AlgR family response regulator
MAHALDLDKSHENHEVHDKINHCTGEFLNQIDMANVQKSFLRCHKELWFDRKYVHAHRKHIYIHMQERKMG